jgi:hypothetical protein
MLGQSCSPSVSLDEPRPVVPGRGVRERKDVLCAPASGGHHRLRTGSGVSCVIFDERVLSHLPRSTFLLPPATLTRLTSTTAATGCTPVVALGAGVLCAVCADYKTRGAAAIAGSLSVQRRATPHASRRCASQQLWASSLLFALVMRGPLAPPRRRRLGQRGQFFLCRVIFALLPLLGAGNDDEVQH